MKRVGVVGLEKLGDRVFRGQLREISVQSLDSAADDAMWSGIDAVAFLAPWEEGHVALVDRLFAARLPVMLAADPSLSGAPLEKMSSTAQRGGARFVVCNPERFLPSRRLIKQHLAAGKLGEVGLVRLHRWETAAARRLLPEHALPPAVWRDIDVTLWLVGSQPNVVFATGTIRDPQGLCYVQLHLGFPGGAMAVIDYSNRLPEGDGYGSLSVIAAAGAAYADDHQNMQLLYRGGRPVSLLTDEAARAWETMLREFIDAAPGEVAPGSLLGGQAGTDDFGDWRRVDAVARAAVESLLGHRAARVREN